MNERDELARELFIADNFNQSREASIEDWENSAPAPQIYRTMADAILAAGYRKPRTITTAEELDALPVGSVVHSEKYIHHANGMQISFQRWDDGLWHRGARSSDTHPSNFLPATVLWEPR